MCGSLQAASSNLTLLHRAGELIEEMFRGTVTFTLFDGLRDLPLFDLDIERDGASREAVTALRSTLAGADALLIASPEYGHSLPGRVEERDRLGDRFRRA